jgi:trans-aconitate methyltransferase
MRDKPAVLNLACGPCRDVLEAITQAGGIAEGSYLHCVDSEGMAINYAKELLTNIDRKNISFTFSNANVLRLRHPHRYDLVWTAGLFDYLEDRLAVVLLRKMWAWMKDRGILVVGNFHPRNSSRNLMEWCANWVLIHRTEEDFFRLCNEAGIPEKHIKFEQEPLGVCIFLVVQKEE